MALVLADRVKETSTTTGTGTFSLSGAASGFESFVTGVGNGNTTYYAIVNPSLNEWEVGIGTVTDSTTDTLARTTIIASSNSDSAVNFGAGTKDVFCTYPASKSVYKDANGDLVLSGNIAAAKELIGPSASANLTRFPNALSVVSNTGSGIQQNEGGYIGLIGEATADSTNTSLRAAGLYGVGYTQGGGSGEGVNGEAHVSSSSDTASAVGVRAYSNDTHSGGLNIGLYANASGSSVGNYALYLKNGDIYSFGAQTWLLNGNLTLSGSYTTSLSTLNLTNALGVAYGGTGVTTSTGSGNNVLSTSPTLVTPILGTPTSATLTNATGLPLTTGVTGTLPVANGGTGVTSAGTSGNILTSNGTAWVSQAPSISTGKSIAMAIVFGG